MSYLSELIEHVGGFAESVGFTRITSLESDSGAHQQGVRWEAPYAQLVVWSIKSASESSIRSEVESAQEILDSILISIEKKVSKVVDGYLMFVLGNEPDSDLRALIRNIELDTRVCRKSFVWPSKRDDAEAKWWRVWRTTVIGLRESPAPGSGVDLPELKETHKEIWREISKSSSAAAAKNFLMESV